MEIVNRVSAFQNYHNFSDVIAQRTKQVKITKPQFRWKKKHLKSNIIIYAFYIKFATKDFEKNQFFFTKPIS